MQTCHCLKPTRIEAEGVAFTITMASAILSRTMRGRPKPVFAGDIRQEAVKMRREKGINGTKGTGGDWEMSHARPWLLQ